MIHFIHSSNDSLEICRTAAPLLPSLCDGDSRVRLAHDIHDQRHLVALRGGDAHDGGGVHHTEQLVAVGGVDHDGVPGATDVQRPTEQVRHLEKQNGF